MEKKKMDKRFGEKVRKAVIRTFIIGLLKLFGDHPEAIDREGEYEKTGQVKTNKFSNESLELAITISKGDDNKPVVSGLRMNGEDVEVDKYGVPKKERFRARFLRLLKRQLAVYTNGSVLGNNSELYVNGDTSLN